MKIPNPLPNDMRMSRFRLNICDPRLATRRPLLSICACVGIIIFGTVVWQADGFAAGDREQRINQIRSDLPHLHSSWSHDTIGKALIRQRSVDMGPSYDPSEEEDEDSLITTGESWSSGGDHVFPTFDESTPKNITTQLGQTAYLHCIVNNLGDKTVSWIRRKDFHVLTVGLDTYTSDERFQAIHIHNTDDWALQIKFANLRDESVYECQVSSDPKISYFVTLTVLVAKAAIEGSPDLYVKSGSSINLTCLITQSPVPPVFVFWYHDERMINYDASRGEIAVLQKGTTADTAISKMAIVDLQPSDSGNYTCAPSNAEATSITVHVLNGEKPAAMQHDANPALSLSCPSHPAMLHWITLTFLHLIVR